MTAGLAIDVILATVIANRVEAITREMGAADRVHPRAPGLDALRPRSDQRLLRG
jgi:hypothetical protein